MSAWNQPSTSDEAVSRRCDHVRLLSSKQRLKRWKGAKPQNLFISLGIDSLRRHYHICLKATLWNTLQRDHCKEIKLILGCRCTVRI